MGELAGGVTRFGAWRVQRPWRWLLAGMAVLAIATLALALTSASPFVFPDELIYAELARNLALHEALLFRGAYLNLPTILYSLAIAPAYLSGDAMLSYRLAEALNAVMYASTALPLYLLARRWLSPGFSLAAAFLPLLTPDCLYVGTILQENVFLPLVAWSVYFAMRALTAPTRGVAALLGLVLGLSFLGKPQGMFLPLAIAVAFGVNEAFRRAPRESLRRALALWPAVAVYGLILLAHLLKSEWMTHATRVGASSLLGTYASGVNAPAHLTLVKLLVGSAFNLGAIALAMGFVPLALSARYAVWAFREGTEDDRLFVTFTVVFGALLLASSVMVSAVAANAHERYCFYLVPLAWLGGLRFLTQRRLDRPVFALSLAVAAVSVSLLWWVAQHGYTDTFSYMAFWRPMLTLGLPRTTLLGALGAVAYAGVLAALLQRRAWRPAVALALAYGAILTGLAAVPRHALGEVYGAHLAYRNWIRTTLGPTRSLATIADGQDQMDVYLSDFFTRRTMRVFFIKAPLSRWIEHPAPAAPDGELPALSALRDGTAIAAAGPVRLRLPLLGERNGVRLYEKRGRVYLQAPR